MRSYLRAYTLEQREYSRKEVLTYFIKFLEMAAVMLISNNIAIKDIVYKFSLGDIA